MPAVRMLIQKHTRDIFIVKDEGVLDVALLCVDARHADHLHAWAEVAARGHVFIDFHRASLLGQSPDSLLRLQTYVGVVRHRDSSACNTGTQAEDMRLYWVEKPEANHVRCQFLKCLTLDFVNKIQKRLCFPTFLLYDYRFVAMHSFSFKCLNHQKPLPPTQNNGGEILNGLIE